MNVLELNLLHDPTAAMLTILFVVTFVCIGLWKFVIYPIIRYFFVVFCGYKAAKGIVKELRERRK